MEWPFPERDAYSPALDGDPIPPTRRQRLEDHGLTEHYVEAAPLPRPFDYERDDLPDLRQAA